MATSLNLSAFCRSWVVVSVQLSSSNNFRCPLADQSGWVLFYMSGRTHGGVSIEKVHTIDVVIVTYQLLQCFTNLFTRGQGVWYDLWCRRPYLGPLFRQRRKKIYMTTHVKHPFAEQQHTSAAIPLPAQLSSCQCISATCLSLKSGCIKLVERCWRVYVRVTNYRARNGWHSWFLVCFSWRAA